MRSRGIYVMGIWVVVLAWFAVGCAAHKPEITGAMDLEQQLKAKSKEASDLQSSLKDMERKLDRTAKELELSQSQAGVRTKLAGIPAGMDLLPQAKAGECYAKVWVPDAYQKETEQVLKREASERIEVSPAKYEWVEEEVLVKEASKKIVEVPAEYETVSEQVLDTAAHTVWKKGRGPIEKIEDATGEIMCLVEVPATYKTLTRRTLKSPATTREIEIPAEYQTIKVRKLVSSAQTKRIPIEAEYATVTRNVKVSDGRMEWRPVLCETNMTRELISEIQTALSRTGHDPGPIDGVFGAKTRSAVRSFQQAKGFATGGLTLRTLDSLGVKMAQ